MYNNITHLFICAVVSFLFFNFSSSTLLNPCFLCGQSKKVLFLPAGKALRRSEGGVLSDLHTPWRPITFGILLICPDQGMRLPCTAYCASSGPPDQPGPIQYLNESCKNLEPLQASR